MCIFKVCLEDHRISLIPILLLAILASSCTNATETQQVTNTPTIRPGDAYLTRVAESDATDEDVAATATAYSLSLPTATTTRTPLPTWTPYLTAPPSAYTSWTSFVSEELGIQIDYPVYYNLPPYSDRYDCAPFGGSFEDYSDLWIGAHFQIVSWEAEGATLSTVVDDALQRISQLGHELVNTSQGSIKGVPQVTIEYNHILGRQTFELYFINEGRAYFVLAMASSSCHLEATWDGHPEALDEIDILNRMFQTMQFLP